ncbi:DUF2802 domain-containing protein [endosymbiont of unidentified scaly snail isolate Monju]|uniref:DUF2802 domain-containing protein n=1 Tax=endosymbiont of unidentified scaly snail isolate Monju TaxID=1248727 RepID=UPI000389277B|nr:DUF2802 domain-containing protein [endosymbiont of unidentified scaly snail isolate Monju]BAN69591.1 hypothetical protein EBS_1715 [endosymbiont of unidentified scaly snail isolate Monju]
MPEWMLPGLALVVALAAVALCLWQRRELRALRVCLEERLDAVAQRQELAQQSISGLTAGALGMDRRLRRVEATEKWLSDRQETIENQQAAEQPYSQAIRLVQQGASARRLVEELALSESEAELLVRLHGLHDSAA